MSRTQKTVVLGILPLAGAAVLAAVLVPITTRLKHAA
jgi:hypothetical protein